MKRFHKEPRYGSEELKQLHRALEQGTLFYAQGKKCPELEARFAKMHGAQHAIAVSSGTAAIHCAMMALGISPGEEVIVPPITDMGSILPILWQGGVPVFADLDPHTYNLSAESVQRCISERTRAVLAVHLAGNACDLDSIVKICNKRKLALIEDCAQAHGCTYRERSVGTFGHIGCYSFNEFKHISCGDGGICITNDQQLARQMRLASDKCYDRSPGTVDRSPTFLAGNYRMTELQAAVAIAQLGKLKSIVTRRRRWCGRLHNALERVAGIGRPEITPRCDPSWWFYMMRVDNADDFASHLKQRGVPCSAHYIGRPVQDYPLFQNHSAFARGEHPFSRRDYSKESTPVARQILDTCVIIQINEGYTERDLEYCVSAIASAAQATQ